VDLHVRVHRRRAASAARDRAVSLHKGTTVGTGGIVPQAYLMHGSPDEGVAPLADIAVLLDQDFEDSEFRIPHDMLTAANHRLTLLGKQAGKTVQGKRGKALTSWPSVRTDLENAGAVWVDQQVVRDDNLITSRKPEDLEPFSRAFMEALK
jgi:putative intracellular protease/amidase